MGVFLDSDLSFNVVNFFFPILKLTMKSIKIGLLIVQIISSLTLL